MRGVVVAEPALLHLMRVVGEGDALRGAGTAEVTGTSAPRVRDDSTASSGSEVRGVVGAELVLLHLAHRVARELVDDDEGLGVLHAGQ